MNKIKNKEMQIGKAGEYLVCADLCMKGLIAYPSEQGLPYDVVIDVDGKLLKCQVKTTEQPRIIPQRNKETKAYIFNIKRNGKNGISRYTEKDVDVFALVTLDTMSVGYLVANDMPDTINIRVDSLRGTYYDEKGLEDYKLVIEKYKTEKNKSKISRELGIANATVWRMLEDGYKPYMTGARYFSEFIRDRRWFECL